MPVKKLISLQQSGNWQSAYRPSEAQLEQLTRSVEAAEGGGSLNGQAMVPPSLPVQFSHQVCPTFSVCHPPS